MTGVVGHNPGLDACHQQRIKNSRWGLVTKEVADYREKLRG